MSNTFGKMAGTSQGRLRHEGSQSKDDGGNWRNLGKHGDGGEKSGQLLLSRKMGKEQSLEE